MKKIFKNMYESLYSLNNSKFFAGIIMIFLNVGSKFITVKLSKSQESFLRNILSRQVLIFAVAWMGTRDIFMALGLTAIFVILADFLTNENSKFCIMPDSYKKLHKLIDTNNDGILSENEIAQSIKILEKARKLKRETDVSSGNTVESFTRRFNKNKNI
tara:strand:+ start:2655 stop:3131 length:477 start_codon:yes stop_codon:yes gene_type:complete